MSELDYCLNKINELSKKPFKKRSTDLDLPDAERVLLQLHGEKEEEIDKEELENLNLFFSEMAKI